MTKFSFWQSLFVSNTNVGVDRLAVCPLFGTWLLSFLSLWFSVVRLDLLSSFPRQKNLLSSFGNSPSHRMEKFWEGDPLPVLNCVLGTNLQCLLLKCKMIRWVILPLVWLRCFMAHFACHFSVMISPRRRVSDRIQADWRLLWVKWDLLFF